MNEKRQLGLPFAHRPEFARAPFFEAPSNEAALAWLARCDDWPSRRLALFGAAGCGKTHLLHLWASSVGGRVVEAPHFGTDVTGPLAIDEAEAALADACRLMHLFDDAAARGDPVLLAARTPPARWEVALPDLASRLRATATVEIGEADDTILAGLLARLLAERQIGVVEPLQSWLRLRLPRTPAAMREAAARLDRASLAAGGAVTKTIAATVIEEMAACWVEPG